MTDQQPDEVLIPTRGVAVSIIDLAGGSERTVYGLITFQTADGWSVSPTQFPPGPQQLTNAPAFAGSSLPDALSQAFSWIIEQEALESVELVPLDATAEKGDEHGS